MRANPDELEERNEKALGLLAALKVRYQQTSDPASRFVALLKAALACGRAHLADRRGIVPQEAELWGWHRKPTGRGWASLGARMIGASSCWRPYTLLEDRRKERRELSSLYLGLTISPASDESTTARLWLRRTN